MTDNAHSITPTIIIADDHLAGGNMDLHAEEIEKLAKLMGISDEDVPALMSCIRWFADPEAALTYINNGAKNAGEEPVLALIDDGFVDSKTNDETYHGSALAKAFTHQFPNAAAMWVSTGAFGGDPAIAEKLIFPEENTTSFKTLFHKSGYLFDPYSPSIPEDQQVAAVELMRRDPDAAYATYDTAKIKRGLSSLEEARNIQKFLNTLATAFDQIAKHRAAQKTEQLAEPASWLTQHNANQAAELAAAPFELAKEMATDLSNTELLKTEVPDKDFYLTDLGRYWGPEVEPAAEILRQALLKIGSTKADTYVAVTGKPMEEGNHGKISLTTTLNPVPIKELQQAIEDIQKERLLLQGIFGEDAITHDDEKNHYVITCANSAAAAALHRLLDSSVLEHHKRLAFVVGTHRNQVALNDSVFTDKYFPDQTALYTRFRDNAEALKNAKNGVELQSSIQK